MSEKDFLNQFSSDGKKPDSFKEEERIKIEKPKKNIDPKIIIIIGAVLIILGILAYFLFFAPKIEMPDFKGQTKNDVAAWAKQQDIKTNGIVFKEEYNFDNDEGIILSQTIPAGKKVKNDVKITFTVSLGADPDEKIAFPDIKSMDKSEIESWISKNKLTKTKITTTYSDTVEKDQVISYEVKGVDEDDFTRSSTLNISVSKGSKPAGTVTVIDFKGKSYTEAESWAQTNKIKLEKVESYSDKVDAGNIISQSVEANKTMKQNDTLILTVSKGKGVKVPDLNTMNKEQIEKWGTNNNISVDVTYKYSNSDDHILSANVKKGQTVSQTDNIQIVLNAGKYFYAADEELKEVLDVGKPANKLEDWCNTHRDKGIDAFAGNWSSSSDVYSKEYAKGMIVSYEISSYSTGQTYGIDDRLPLDVRFSIVVSKGRYYKLEDLFASSGVKATVADIMEVLSNNNITYILADDISSDDYDKPAYIENMTINDDLYEDKTYTIKKGTEGDLYKLSDKSDNQNKQG